MNGCLNSKGFDGVINKYMLNDRAVSFAIYA